MGVVVIELLWFSYMLKDMKNELNLHVVLRCNNKATIKITKNPVYHERTEHLAVDGNFIRQHYKLSFVTPIHINTSLQTTDLFMKPLLAATFRKFIDKLNLLLVCQLRGCEEILISNNTHYRIQTCTPVEQHESSTVCGNNHATICHHSSLSELVIIFIKSKEIMATWIISICQCCCIKLI